MYLTNVSKDDIVMTSSEKMGKWGLDNSLYIGIVYASSKLQNATPKKSKGNVYYVYYDDKANESIIIY